MAYKERLKALAEGKTVTPPAISLWKHFPMDDLEPDTFTDITTGFQAKYEWDFIKVSHNGLYSVEDWGSKINWAQHRMEVPRVHEFGIQSPKDWLELEPLPPKEGALGREVASTKKILEWSRNQGGEVPVLPTIFSPATTARKMSGERFEEHIKSNKKEVHKALETITETTVNFLKVLLESGIDGIFFATQLATYDLISYEEYKEFGVEYDLRVLEEVQGKTLFNIFHIHGNNTMFDQVKDYPVEALNWHDRRTYPSLRQAREMTDKVLIGGIDEHGTLKTAGEKELAEHVEDAISQVEDGRIILGPGCVVPLDCPESQMEQLKKIVASK